MTKVQATLFVMSVVFVAAISWALAEAVGTAALLFFGSGLFAGLTMAAAFASGRSKS